MEKKLQEDKIDQIKQSIVTWKESFEVSRKMYVRTFLVVAILLHSISPLFPTFLCNETRNG